MANDPKKANQKRDKTKTENDQAEHEGSAHDPSEFDVMNPARPKGKGEAQEQN